MTFPSLRTLGASALLLLLAAPLHGSAQEAPPRREIDAQVLLDDDGLLGYGGCVEAGCVPAEAGGYDLLALDAREAHLGEGAAVVFRIAYAGVANGTERSIRLTYSVQGQVQTVDVAGLDEGNPSALGADAVQGPQSVGPGVWAVDVWLTYSRLGLQAGGTLQDIRVRAIAADGSDDDLPGTWYLEGRQVPHLPHDPSDPGEAVEEHPPGSYVLQGAAVLLAVTEPALRVAHDGAWNFTVANPLATMGQAVVLRLQDGPTVENATFRPSSFLLAPGASQRVEARLPASDVIVVASDLGTRVEIPVEVVAPLPPPGNGTTEEGPDTKDVSGLPAASLLALLGFAAISGRRRTSPQPSS